jgi:hypothetical protein
MTSWVVQLCARAESWARWVAESDSVTAHEFVSAVDVLELLGPRAQLLNRRPQDGCALLIHCASNTRRRQILVTDCRLIGDPVGPPYGVIYEFQEREDGPAPQTVASSRFAARLLDFAAWVLPPADRARYCEEYQAELYELALVGRRAQWAYSVRLVLYSLPLRHALQRDTDKVRVR